MLRRLGGLAFALLRGRLSCLFLDRQDHVGPLPAESPGVEVLDVLRQRCLPRLLAVIVHPAELLRVQPELARHLHLRMRELVPLAGVDPVLQSRWEGSLLVVPIPTVPTLASVRRGRPWRGSA